MNGAVTPTKNVIISLTDNAIAESGGNTCNTSPSNENLEMVDAAPSFVEMYSAFGKLVAVFIVFIELASVSGFFGDSSFLRLVPISHQSPMSSSFVMTQFRMALRHN
jgi:hypothetical protein